MIGMSMFTLSMKEEERRKFRAENPQSWSMASSLRMMFLRSRVPPQREKSVRSKFVMYYLRVL